MNTEEKIYIEFCCFYMTTQSRASILGWIDHELDRHFDRNNYQFCSWQFKYSSKCNNKPGQLSCPIHSQGLEKDGCSLLNVFRHKVLGHYYFHMLTRMGNTSWENISLLVRQNGGRKRRKNDAH